MIDRPDIYQQQRTAHDEMLVNVLVPISKETEGINVMYGPKYHTSTSTGMGLEISTYLYTEDRDKNTDIVDNVVLVARDEKTKEVVGFRRNILRKGSPTEPLTSDGSIMVKNRGMGIATQINLAMTDVHQRIANNTGEEGQQLVWLVKNDNLVGCEQAKNNLEMLIDPNYAKLLENLAEEQRRWLSLYGEEGTMGFSCFTNPEAPKSKLWYARSFNHQGSDETVEITDISDIWFEKTEKFVEGRKLYNTNIVGMNIVAEKDEYIKSRKAEMVGEILPSVN